ncbi:MAG: hypothetical protein ACREJ4_10030, partial [Candidatus Methylomirabilaceae bacterium]
MTRTSGSSRQNPRRFAGLAAFCATLLVSPSEAVILDRVVAVVNDDVITLTDVQEEGLQTIRKVVQETLGDDRNRRLRTIERQILDE